MTVDPAALVRGASLDALRALLTDDAEWWVAGPVERLPFAGTFSGPDGFDRWRTALNAAVRYDAFAVTQELTCGDEVIHIVTASGHAVATGRPYASEVVRIFTVRDGRIVRARSYYDTAAYAAALGG